MTDNANVSEQLASSANNDYPQQQPTNTNDNISEGGVELISREVSDSHVQQYRPHDNEKVLPQAKHQQSRSGSINSFFQRLGSLENQTQKNSRPAINYAKMFGEDTPIMDVTRGIQADQERVMDEIVKDDDTDSDSEVSEKNPNENNEPDQPETHNPLARVESAVTSEVERINKKFGFFDSDFKYKSMLLYIIGNLILMVIIIGIFSLFWGAMYKRETRFKHFEFAIIQDDPKIYDGTEITDVFSETLMKCIENPSVQPLAGWMPRYYTNYTDDPSELYQKLHERIYHQSYWAVIWVKPNSSINYYNALQKGEQFNITDVMHVMWETGRQYAGVGTYLSKSISTLQGAVLKMQPLTITEPLSKHLDDDQLEAAIETFSTPLSIVQHDLTDSRLTKPIALAPQIFGPIYLHILSLMQLSYFVPYHAKIGAKLENRAFLMFRLISSQLAYLLIALIYTLVQIAFKIDIYVAYPGRSGFIVFWILTYLLLAALGGVNENVCILLKIYAPNMIPSWMFFWIALNVAPASYPLNLCPKFYRFGYAMPIFNGCELYKILLFDTWKQASLARNIVVLIAYSIISIIANPFCLKLLIRKRTKTALGKAKRLKKEKREKLINKRSQRHPLLSKVKRCESVHNTD